jgi:hypothetical protein
MLSVIIAYVNEYPQVLFTIRAIAEELLDRVDFEIIAINNYCDEVVAQGRQEDKGEGAIVAATGVNSWLKHLKYNTKLSHWQAKNLGVKEAKGDIFWFPDAHVVPSRNTLYHMFQHYKTWYPEINGTLHLPIGYQILESSRLIYGLVSDPKIGKYFYQFTPCPDNSKIFEVPVMSTCGCMMHRSIYDKIGGWPEEIGIYGGGEPFFNFSMAVLGMTKNIWPTGCLYHHGEERGYNWNYDGWVRDELIAAYCYGGNDLMKLKAKHMDGLPEVINRIQDDILSKSSIKEHRGHIIGQQKMSIEEWVLPWLNAS